MSLAHSVYFFDSCWNYMCFVCYRFKLSEKNGEDTLKKLGDESEKLDKETKEADIEKK